MITNFKWPQNVCFKKAHSLLLGSSHLSWILFIIFTLLLYLSSILLEIFFLSLFGIQMMMVMRASKKQFSHGSVGTISETVYHLLDHYFRDEDSASVSIFSFSACKQARCVCILVSFSIFSLPLSLSLWFLFRVVPVSFETRLIQHSHETI